MCAVFLLCSLQVSSFGENPLLQPAAARLANAMIAVLGPEFTLGSAAYSRCKTLVTCYNTTSSGAKRGTGALGAGAAAAGVGEGIRGLAATWAELEQVICLQLICSSVQYCLLSSVLVSASGSGLQGNRVGV